MNMNLLLAVTAETWIVTGLGFGIVLVLLICLIYILKFFGWVMQTIAAPKAPKTENAKAAAPAKSKAEVKVSPVPTDEGTMAAIAMALSEASDDDKVAIAMALHLYFGHSHDIAQTMLTMTAKPTAWNSKAFGMNNAGF